MKFEKKYLSKPLTAQLEITDFCNHKCIHCYNLDSKPENRPNRAVDDDTVIRIAQTFIDNQIFGVVVTGGEPLIKKKLTKSVLSLLKDNKIKVSLNSNITLFDDDFIDFLKHKKIGVLTSCPSANTTSFSQLVGVDNYSLFENNIKKLVAANIHFTVNMVITKENLHEIRYTAEKMKNLGCKSFTATPMGLNVDYPRLDLLLSKDDVRAVIDELLLIEEKLGLRVDILEALPKCIFSEQILSEKHSFLNRRCQAGRTNIAVSCNGDVRPCAHNPTSYGNVLQDDLKNIWQNMSDWRSSQYVPDECKDCAWLNRCNGACRTSAKTANGEWNSKDIWATAPLKTAPTKENKQISLHPETQLQVNQEYFCRQEYEDAFVFYNMKDDIYFMVSKSYCDFIFELKTYDTVSYGDLQKKYNVNADDKNFNDAISFLIQKNMLKII
jgi:radical SAM protein with 4Fe4S-binding SPASM domain